MLCNSMQATYAKEMETVFEALDGEGFQELSVPDSSAFSHARSKLQPTAFVELNRRLLGLAAGLCSDHVETWKGYRMVGLDGSTLQLPDTPGIRAEFDPGAPAGGIPHARVSQCVDVLNHICLDSQISPIAVGERELFRRHLDPIADAGGLLLMDRGYAAHWLFQLCLVESVPFVARLKLSHTAAVREFVASGATEGEILFKPTASSRNVLADEGVEPVPLRLRVVRIELSSGKTEVLATSLPPEEMSLDDLDLCYELRWGSETAYRHQKSHMHVENFSGRTARSVRQDYHATVFIQNLAAVLALPLHAMIREATAHRKHTYQLNFASAARAMRGRAVRFLGRAVGFGKALVEALVKCAKNLSIWRYGRIFERRKKNPGRKHHTSYKPIS